MTTAGPRRRGAVHLLAVQEAAILVGVVLMLFGVLGFVPGITTDIDALQLTGHSGTLLFGVFEVSAVHNLIHLALGIAALVMARTFRRARAFLLLAGASFLGLFAWGLLIHPGGPGDLIGLNNADNWLHFGLGVAMIVLALTLAGTRVPTDARGKALLPPSG